MNKIKRRVFMWFGAVFCIVWLLFIDIVPLQQGIPELELVLKEFDWHTKTILVQLTVRNSGNVPLSLPHLTEKRLRNYYVWGGWFLNIGNSNGELFGYGQYPGIILWKPHIIRLQPGKSFSVSINIAEAKRIARFKEEDTPFPPEVASVPGEYHVSIRLNLYPYENIPPYLINTVWKGSLESNTIKFIIAPAPSPTRRASSPIPTL